MTAALNMLRALQKQTEAEITRLRLQSQAMGKALALLEARRTSPQKVRTGHISSKGIARIKAAQKARWAAYRKQQAELAKGK